MSSAGLYTFRSVYNTHTHMCTQHTHAYITHSGTCMQAYTNILQTEKVC